MRAVRWPRLPVRRAACAIVMVSALAGPGTALAAQSATTTAPHSAKHRKTSAAAKKTAAPVQPVAPVAPPAPNWPVNSSPGHAAVTWDSRTLRIEAANSSLLAILADVSSATGTKIVGAGQDHRIFGNYGPGPARDVLSQLFEGLGYNVLMTGENDLGVPREVQLSARGAGGSAPGAMPAGRPQPQAQPDDDYVDDTPAPEPEQPPQPQGAPAPNPQDEQRQQLIQPGQQPGQQPQQQPNS